MNFAKSGTIEVGRLLRKRLCMGITNGRQNHCHAVCVSDRDGGHDSKDLGKMASGGAPQVGKRGPVDICRGSVILKLA